MAQFTNDNGPLRGVTALIVEDDLLLAMDLEATLEGAGGVVVGVCHTLGEAMARADADDFGVAVLDFSLGSNSVAPLARRLARREVPFVLYTGMPRGEPSLMEWRNYPIVEKPASPHTLVSAIRTMLSLGEGRIGASPCGELWAQPAAQQAPHPAPRARPASRERG